MKAKAEKLNDSRRASISNYILMQLSKHGVTAMNFCKMAGIDQTFISNLKKQAVWDRIPNTIWEFFDGLRENNSFMSVMRGESKYISAKGKVTRGVVEEIKEKLADGGAVIVEARPDPDFISEMEHAFREGKEVEFRRDLTEGSNKHVDIMGKCEGNVNHHVLGVVRISVAIEYDKLVEENRVANDTLFKSGNDLHELTMRISSCRETNTKLEAQLREYELQKMVFPTTLPLLKTISVGEAIDTLIKAGYWLDMNIKLGSVKV